MSGRAQIAHVGFGYDSRVWACHDWKQRSFIMYRAAV